MTITKLIVTCSHLVLDHACGDRNGKGHRFWLRAEVGAARYAEHARAERLRRDARGRQRGGDDSPARVHVEAYGEVLCVEQRRRILLETALNRALALLERAGKGSPSRARTRLRGWLRCSRAWRCARNARCSRAGYCRRNRRLGCRLVDQRLL